MKPDLRSIVKVWEQSERAFVPFVFVPAAPHDGVMDAVEAAVASANAAVAAQRADGGTDFACTEPWPAPRGAAFVALVADTREGLESWIDAFAAHLDAAGIEGRLGAEKPSYPALFSTRVVALSAVVALEGWEARAKHESTPGWFARPQLGERVFDWAVDWVAHGDSTIHFGLGLTMFPRDPEVARTLLPGAAHRNSRPRLVNAPDLDHVRFVCLDESGRLVVQLRDATRPWIALLDEMQQVLSEFADVTEFGLIRYATAGKATAAGVVSGWPPPRLPGDGTAPTPTAYLHSERYLDREFVLDAYGVQVIGERHLAKVHDLSQWQVTPIAPGRYLVQAPNLAAWFATETPDLDMVEQARRDFGRAILRGEPARQADPPREE